jgi:hypothetical protein
LCLIVKLDSLILAYTNIIKPNNDPQNIT